MALLEMINQALPNAKLNISRKDAETQRNSWRPASLREICRLAFRAREG